LAEDTGGGTTGCPTVRPPASASCATAGLTCEFGDDPSVSCDTVLTCTNGAWVVTQPAPVDPCPTANSAACPAAYPDVTQGVSCSTQVDCYYPEARCSCDVQCFDLCPEPVDGGPNLKKWGCDVPPAPTTCPIPRPRIGSPCTVPSESCDYGACRGNVAIQCTDGIWQELEVGCPA